MNKTIDKDIIKKLNLHLGEAMDTGYAKLHFNEISNLIELYERQQAEIERLKKLLDGAETCIDELEYAFDKVGHSNSRVDDALEKYNNLVKDMVGEGK